MIEIWILAGALVACGLYISYLTYKLDRVTKTLENANMVIGVMICREAKNDREL